MKLLTPDGAEVPVEITTLLLPDGRTLWSSSFPPSTGPPRTLPPDSSARSPASWTRAGTRQSRSRRHSTC